MTSGGNGERRKGLRRSVLDLAPLELDCMNALWPLGEATVRQVQEALSPRRPRAYTTIMTILDRLAQKGVVERRKVGRAYVYHAHLRTADAQQKAVEQLVEGFFGGSRAALAEHLAGGETRDDRAARANVAQVQKKERVSESGESATESGALDSILL